MVGPGPSSGLRSLDFEFEFKTRLGVKKLADRGVKRERIKSVLRGVSVMGRSCFRGNDSGVSADAREEEGIELNGGLERNKSDKQRQ